MLCLLPETTSSDTGAIIAYIVDHCPSPSGTIDRNKSHNHTSCKSSTIQPCPSPTTLYPYQTSPNHQHIQQSATPTTMFSCANYERGCRGRCNATDGRCDSCVVLNLQSVRSNSASSMSSTNGRPQAAYSALTSSFASLSSAKASQQRAS
jgi:hypothetical protein